LPLTQVPKEGNVNGLGVLQIEMVSVTKLGKGLTVTITVPVAEQPVAIIVPVTVYVAVVVGLAVTIAKFVTFKPVVGDQSKSAGTELPDTVALAVRLTDAPAQIVAGATFMVGLGFTVTDTVPEFEQPVVISVPVTVYVAVVVGLAVTEAKFVTFKPVAGDQVKAAGTEVPDTIALAVRLTDAPAQIGCGGGVTFIVGLGFMVITT
jgi:hypothetical protein